MMKKTVFLASSLLMMFLSWTSIAHAQNMGETAGSEENTLNKLMSMLNTMTDAQKEYARANWLVVPKEYVNTHDHPSSFVIFPNPTPDTQNGNECAACSSAYLLRFYGEDVDGVSLYHQPSFPCKYGDGAYPRCFKVLFEEQYKNYTTEYFTGTTDDLKNAVSKVLEDVPQLKKDVKSSGFTPIGTYAGALI